MTRPSCPQLGISSLWTLPPTKPTFQASDANRSAQEQSHEANFIF